MPEPEPFLILICVAALFAGGMVKGSIGLGLPLVSISLLASFMEVSSAVPILTISIVLANLWQAIQTRYFRPALKRFWPVIVAMGIGIAVGADLIVAADPRILHGVVGGLVIVFVLNGLFGGNFTVSPRAERWVGPVVGGTAGVVGGLTGMFGPINALFLASLKLLKNEFVGAIGCTQFFGSIFLVLAFTSTGLLNRESVVWSALAVLPVALGLWAGQKLRDRVDQRNFRRLVLGFLLVIGLNLLRRALV